MNKPDSPTDLQISVYLMCPPFVSSFNNQTKNNPLMRDGVVIDYNKAFNEWLQLYRFLASQGMVYLLPNEGWHQDQIYVANLGMVLHHLEQPTVVISNYMSLPRRGEEKAGYSFFEQMKYKCVRPDSYFEGEADCKFIRNNLYIGGYGIRTSLLTYQWMQDEFDCKVIPIQMYDKKLYHFDCVFFPLDEETAIVNTSILADDDVDLLEKYIDVISVPKELRYTGITNLCRIGSIVLCRNLEQNGRRWLDGICVKRGYDVKYFELSTQDSNGADLSCCILHMNKPNHYTSKSVVAGIRNFFSPKGL